MKSVPLTNDESSDATGVSEASRGEGRCFAEGARLPVLTEDNALGLLDGLAEAAHGAVDEAAVELLGGVEEVHKEGRLDGAAAS